MQWLAPLGLFRFSFGIPLNSKPGNGYTTSGATRRKASSSPWAMRSKVLNCKETSRRGAFYAILGVWAGPEGVGRLTQSITTEVGSSVKRLISSKVAMWALAAGAALTLPAWADPKIGVVDAQRLLEESPQGKAMLESMRSEFAPRQRTLQAQQQTLKAKQDKLQKDGATMSEDQRQRAEKELRDGARDLQRARQEFQDDISARRNEEMSRLQRTLGRGGAHLRQGAELRPGVHRRRGDLRHAAASTSPRWCWRPCRRTAPPRAKPSATPAPAPAKPSK